METQSLFTRADYLAGKCTHSQYYAQFVTRTTKELVKKYIGLDKIKASTDHHFNDIPIKQWDELASGGVPRAIAFIDVGDFSTLAGNICIAKEAARQIKLAHLQLEDAP